MYQISKFYQSSRYVIAPTSKNTTPNIEIEQLQNSDPIPHNFNSPKHQDTNRVSCFEQDYAPNSPQNSCYYSTTAYYYHAEHHIVSSKTDQSHLIFSSCFEVHILVCLDQRVILLC